MKNEQIIYKLASKEELAETQYLIERVFKEHVAPNYSNEGVREFYTYTDTDAMASRLDSNHFMLIAKEASEIVGVIEMRNNDHISLLFVDTKHQGKGIARTLFNLAVERCRHENPELKEITVNSSPNAAMAYERLGFKKTEDERIKNGIRFIQMSLSVNH